MAPGDPVVIHVGRMAAEKNYPLLFRVYAAMRQANPACRFVLAGEGPLKRKLMQDHPECIFAGFFSRDEIRSLLCLGRYLHPREPLRKPSATSSRRRWRAGSPRSRILDHAAARMFVKDGETGLSAPCDDPDALIAAGVQALADRRGPSRAHPDRSPQGGRGPVVGQGDRRLRNQPRKRGGRRPHGNPARLLFSSNPWSPASSSSQRPTAKATMPPPTRPSDRLQ